MLLPARDGFALSRAVAWLRMLSVAGLLLAGQLAVPGTARAATLVPVNGSGSTWSSNAMQQWISDVDQYGIRINFAANGSSDGRTAFKNGTVDFAVSEIPYGVTDGGVYEPPPTTRQYAYMPIVAGGTSFMYQLHVNGQQVTNLRLSGQVIAKIFTGGIKLWSDPAIAADNPGLTLPAEPIVPVVRADGSGTTAQLTTWMAKRYQSIWDAYCAANGRPTPCGTTSNYPVLKGSGFVAEQQSSNLAGFIAQKTGEGTIGYVEYSYAVESNYPVAKVLNDAGYYTEPTASNVAVALTAAKINTDPTSPQYLTQVLDGVYANPDPRTYPLSSYSYMIIPTGLQAPFTSDKGYTLGKFAYYFLCEGQQRMGDLGYSPLPVNLVQASFDQVRKIPGVDVQSINIASCHNPTLGPGGTNALATSAKQPQGCDKQAVVMCPDPTGGATTPTTVVQVSVPTTTAPAAGGNKPTSKPGDPKATKTPAGTPGTPGSPGSTPAPRTTVSSGGSSGGSGGTGTSGQSLAPGGSPAPGGGVTAAPGGGKALQGQGSGAAAGGGAAVADPFNPGVAQPSAAGGQASGGQVSGGSAVQILRAVPVSVAESTGWSLDDTLMVLAAVLCVLVTVGPPLVSRQLSKRRRS